MLLNNFILNRLSYNSIPVLSECLDSIWAIFSLFVSGKKQRKNDDNRKPKRHHRHHHQIREGNRGEGHRNRGLGLINSSTMAPGEGRSRRAQRSAVFFDLHDIHHVQHHENQCNHHRLDHCPWPQCNRSCPKVRNPFTGEEMDIVDLLVHFGLDLSSIAQSVGKDVATIQSMDHSLLLPLLMQNSTD